jgi:quercetin dioxygenase-like cupin family protein
VNAGRQPLDIRLGSDGSAGNLSVIEAVVAPGSPGPPLHVHPGLDEGWYVLDGELTFRVGGDQFEGGPGAFAFAPRGTPHTLANLGTTEARMLIVSTPAGLERLLLRLAATQAGAEPPPDADGPAPEMHPVGQPIQT